jgi:3-hydroxyacyl-[acyl-carrier-protein] dehydratase
MNFRRPQAMLIKEEIKNIIPHRDPFLFIDEIIELDPGVKGVGKFTLTGEEFFLKGHYPGNPIMPGVLIVEALAQTGGVVVMSLPEFQGKTPLFGGISKARFKRMVVPGDTLTLEVTIERIIKNAGFGKAKATVNGEVACIGEITFIAV